MTLICSYAICTYIQKADGINTKVFGSKPLHKKISTLIQHSLAHSLNEQFAYLPTLEQTHHHHSLRTMPATPHVSLHVLPVLRSRVVKHWRVSMHMHIRISMHQRYTYTYLHMRIHTTNSINPILFQTQYPIFIQPLDTLWVTCLFFIA